MGIFKVLSDKVPTISYDNESLQNLPQDLASTQMKGNVGAMKAPILFDMLQLSMHLLLKQSRFQPTDIHVFNFLTPNMKFSDHFTLASA